MENKKLTLLEQKEALIRYIKVKTHQQDWHGVMDAVMDIRELEAKYPELKNVWIED